MLAFLFPMSVNTVNKKNNNGDILQIALEESSLGDSLSPVVFAHNDANTPNMVIWLFIFNDC